MNLTRAIRSFLQAQRRAAGLLAAVLVAACGGGGSAPPAPAPAPPPAPPIVSVYGDSSAAGIALNPRPATELAALLGARVIDYSMPGTTLDQVILRDDDGAAVVLLRHGGAHAAHHGLAGLDAFDASLCALIAQAQATGAQVVLTGLISFAPAPWLPDADNARILAMLDAYDARLRAIAARLNLPFVDLRAVPFAGRADLIDDVHPGQAYSGRLTAAIAATLADVLRHRRTP